MRRSDDLRGTQLPIGHAAGLGLDGAVSEADLDRLEMFYRSHGAPAQLDLCPLTDLTLLELVKARGYGVAELNNVLYVCTAPWTRRSRYLLRRKCGSAEASPNKPRSARSFFERGDAPEGFADMLAPLFQTPEALTFALVDENPVAGAAGRIIPEHRIFALFGAGTLPAFRRRGIQTALLRTRMKAAADVVVTRGGTISERNWVRLGFRIAYS